MKIHIRSDNAGWIFDEITKDFKQHSRHKVVGEGGHPELIWTINPFSFLKSSCKNVIQIHHIDTDKLREYNFGELNKADYCIVPNKITYDMALKYLKIPITILPYWLLTKVMAPKDKEKVNTIKKEICPNEEILIGSFVKDGNGKDGYTPKSAKNPDLFLEIIKKLHSQIKLKVLLAGYGREYVRQKLKALKIPYVYFQKYLDINVLYDCLDWYLVTSKYEGGPQSILEASYRQVKILSTNVGMAPEILHKKCICNHAKDFVDVIMSADKMKSSVNYNYSVVASSYMAMSIIPKYDDYFDFCIGT